jgi:hypothetical protein
LYVITAVPKVIPVITPTDDILITAVSLLLQLPPAIVLLSVLGEPKQICGQPVIAGGVGLTVTSAPISQPVARIVYVMPVVPARIPVTTPLITPTVPTVGTLLAHAPPGVALASVVVEPSHTCNVPVILAGSGFTVTWRTLIQPVAPDV